MASVRAAHAAMARLACAAAFALASGLAQAGPVRFAVFGDAPYFPFESAMVTKLLAKLGEEPVEFVIHIGDIKASFEPCSDELLRQRIAQIDASARPVVFTPGDNDWTDCHRDRAGRFDPLDRLQALRRFAYPAARSLGRTPIAVASQADDPPNAEYVENRRWRAGGVLFTTIHVVGSNNNYARTGAADREHADRMQANLAWLDATRAEALQSDVRAVVLAFHADPLFGANEGRGGRDGYRTFRAALAEFARSVRKPILLAHGDSHAFRFDQPLADRGGAPFPHVARLQTFGSPTVAAVVVTIDPDAAEPIRVAPYRVTPESPGQ